MASKQSEPTPATQALMADRDLAWRRVSTLSYYMDTILNEIIDATRDVAGQAPESSPMANLRWVMLNICLDDLDDLLREGLISEEGRTNMERVLSSPPFHKLVHHRANWLLCGNRPSHWGRRVYMEVCRQTGVDVPKWLLTQKLTP